MANAYKWETPGSFTSYLTTELNALANAANKLGAAIDNATAKNMYLSLQLFVNTQAGARSAGAYVAIYLLPSIDATNYTYGDDSTDPPANRLLATLPLDAAVTARYQSEVNLLIPPYQFKLLLENDTGQTFAATGTILAYRTHNGELQ